MADLCGACCGGGFFGNLAGTLGNTYAKSRVPCIECRGTGRQNAAQQAIVDAINARVLARREDAA